jgi:hypothetical protein
VSSRHSLSSAPDTSGELVPFAANGHACGDLPIETAIPPSSTPTTTAGDEEPSAGLLNLLWCHNTDRHVTGGGPAMRGLTLLLLQIVSPVLALPLYGGTRDGILDIWARV